MTAQAVALQDLTVLGIDDDGFVEDLECEPFGVVVAVFRLGHVLGDETLRQMAVDAARNTVMGGFLPRIKLRLHDVTVCASSWVRAEVGQALGILECEDTEASHNPYAGQATIASRCGDCSEGAIHTDHEVADVTQVPLQLRVVVVQHVVHACCERQANPLHLGSGIEFVLRHTLIPGKDRYLLDSACVAVVETARYSAQVERRVHLQGPARAVGEGALQLQIFRVEEGKSRVDV